MVFDKEYSEKKKEQHKKELEKSKEKKSKFDSKGQGVMPGVETDIETEKRVAEEEKQRIQNGIVDIHRQITDGIAVFTEIRTLEGLAYLKAIQNFIDALKWMKEKTMFGTGRVFYAKRINAKSYPVLKLNVQYQDAKENVVSTVKKNLLDVVLRGSSDLFNEQ